MNDDDLRRYSRQILLPQIDYSGQQRIRASRIAIIGVGGLGCPAALTLQGAGVGTLTLVDPDRVEPSNLPRQTLFDELHVGRAKVQAAAERLRARDPQSTIQCLEMRATPPLLTELAANHDVVLDATDHFDIRDAINAAGFAQRTPIVSGAALGWYGQIATFDFRSSSSLASGCYRCLYSDAPEEHAPRCSDAGVINTATQIIGNLQAHEALRIILGLKPLYGESLGLLDLLNGGLRGITRTRDPTCPICSASTPEVVGTQT